MTTEIAGVSSMATKHLLAELAGVHARQTGNRVSVISMGGVEVAARVRAREPYDFAVLAAEALAKLETEKLLVAGSRVDVALAAIAVAVSAGSKAPDISSEGAVRDAVTGARSIGFSTGPSGAHLLRLLERWGIAESVKPRLVQAPPGVPVAALLARGEVELGFQQLSELIHEPGIDVVGTLPPGAQALTPFSAAACSASTRAEATRAWLRFLAAPENDACKRRHGLEPMKAP
jgi:molybdate transport system substrate-binding protein